MLRSVACLQCAGVIFFPSLFLGNQLKRPLTRILPAQLFVYVMYSLIEYFPFLRISSSLFEPNRKKSWPTSVPPSFLYSLLTLFLLIFVCLSCRHSVPPFRFHYVSFFNMKPKKKSRASHKAAPILRRLQQKSLHMVLVFLMNQIMFRLFLFLHFPFFQFVQVSTVITI